MNSYRRSLACENLKRTVSSTPLGVFETAFTNYFDLNKKMTTLV